MNLNDDLVWCTIACVLISVLLFVVIPAVCFAPSGTTKLLIFAPTFIITMVIAQWMLK